MKLSKKAQLEERVRELEEDLRYEKNVSDSFEQSAREALDVAYIYEELLGEVVEAAGDVGDMTIGDFPAFIKSSLDELNDIKVRIRQFTWELK